MVVVFSEMLLDVFPDIDQVDEVEVQFELVFPGQDLVLDCVGIRAVVSLLVAFFKVLNEAVAKGPGALGGKGFVIWFDIH